MPKGCASGSRVGGLLGTPAAGAAHGTGSEDKLATLIPSFPEPSEGDIVLVWE